MHNLEVDSSNLSPATNLKPANLGGLFPMKEKLWNFTDNSGSFELPGADKIRALYFPLCNDSIMSSVTPDLHGDIKTGQNSFLLTPESRIDLINSKSSRSFWVYSDEKTVWPITKEGQVNLSAGLL